MRCLALKTSLRSFRSVLLLEKKLIDLREFATIYRGTLRNLLTLNSGRFFTEKQVYSVQTPTKLIESCLLMTTDPGDLVLDPTCGSGTTAYVAEQWGRRWITCDTSRVAITLAKQRLLTSSFDYYELAHPSEGSRQRLRLEVHKVQMNADLLTDDLKKKRSSNESFWLIGQPDIEVEKNVESIPGHGPRF